MIDNDELEMLIKAMEEAEQNTEPLVCNTENPENCESCSG